MLGVQVSYDFVFQAFQKTFKLPLLLIVKAVKQTVRVPAVKPICLFDRPAALFSQYNVHAPPVMFTWNALHIALVLQLS